MEKNLGKPIPPASAQAPTKPAAPKPAINQSASQPATQKPGGDKADTGRESTARPAPKARTNERWQNLQSHLDQALNQWNEISAQMKDELSPD